MDGSEPLESRSLEGSDSLDQQQFVRLFVANQRRVHAFIRVLIPNGADADDVLQETSITGLAKFSTSFLQQRDSQREFPIEEFVAWICTIARFEALKWCRQRKRGNVFFCEALTEQLATSQSRQLDYLETRHEALNACIEKLPPRDRTVLLFRYDSNFSGPEISERLGWPVNTVYKALQRIRHALIACIDRTIHAQGHP